MCRQAHQTASVQQGDPWAATISQLEQVSDHADTDELVDQNDETATETHAEKSRRADAGASHASGYGRNAVVTFVERIDARSVSLSWRDSTGGNYREQRWVLRAARTRGVCALSGQAIVRGDNIYHPVSGSRGAPSNLAQMIRADALERFE
jgi:hypothetical protein